MVYLADRASFSVNMNQVAGGKASAAWIDPRTGDSTQAGTFPTTGTRDFSTPDGWEDALLLLDATSAK